MKKLSINLVLDEEWRDDDSEIGYNQCIEWRKWDFESIDKEELIAMYNQIESFINILFKDKNQR